MLRSRRKVIALESGAATVQGAATIRRAARVVDGRGAANRVAAVDRGSRTRSGSDRLLGPHILLSFRTVLSSVRLNRLGSIVRLLDCHVLDLGRLTPDDLACMVQTIVDCFAILDIDEGCQIHDEGRDQSQAPEWNKLDEPVGEEGSRECLSRG